MIKSAVVSECGTYRYELIRRWGTDENLLNWIMLNPSTADASMDDPTIRRCIRFAKDWAYDGIRVTNLFALRATDPRELANHPDPWGPDNHLYLGRQDGVVIAAWGANKMAECPAILDDVTLMCLGTTASGAPKHPLYLKSDSYARVWRQP